MLSLVPPSLADIKDFKSSSNPPQDAKDVKSSSADGAVIRKVAQAARILVIDDSMLQREVLINLIGQVDPDAQVTVAEDGKIGLNKATKEPFHLIYCDNLMPFLCGIQVIPLIRKEGPNKDTPIIGMSGDDSKDEMIKAGANCFLPKPIFANQIRDIHVRIFKPMLTKK